MEIQKDNLSGVQQAEEHQPSNDWHFRVGFWKQPLSSFGNICCLFFFFPAQVGVCGLGALLNINDSFALTSRSFGSGIE